MATDARAKYLTTRLLAAFLATIDEAPKHGKHLPAPSCSSLAAGFALAGLTVVMLSQRFGS